MQILSAADAVSPAITRTKQVLFAPFRMGRSWKISATGYLAFSSTVFLPFPLFYIGTMASLERHGHTHIAAAVLIGIIVLLLLFAVFFYVFSRLQFVFFDLVLTREQFVAPSWRKFGPQTWPWIVTKIVFGTAFLVLAGAPFFPFILHGFQSMQHLNQVSAQAVPPDVIFRNMGRILYFEFLVAAGFGVLLIFDSLLTDFVLPSMALENTTVREAFRRFGQLIRREPGQMALYLLLKTALTFVGYIAQTILLYILALIYVILMGIVFLIGYFVLHALHVSVPVMIVIAAVIFIPTYLWFIFYAVLLLFGVLLTFLQAYALYFLGGRYPLLGEMLDRSTPAPPSLTPPPPPMYADDPPNPYAYLNLPPTSPTV